MIIGLYGGIGHGKTTLATYLEHAAPSFRHIEASDMVIEVANDLRIIGGPIPDASDLSAINEWLTALVAILAARMHCMVTEAQLMIDPADVDAEPTDYEKLFQYLNYCAERPDRQAVVITAETKDEFRSLLQWLGGYLVRHVNDGVWFDEIVRRIQADPNIELHTVSGLRFPEDATRIRQAGGTIVRISRPISVDKDKHDVTERERDQINPDVTVLNDSSLLELTRCAKDLYSDLAKSAAAKTYRASDY